MTLIYTRESEGACVRTGIRLTARKTARNHEHSLDTRHSRTRFRFILSICLGKFGTYVANCLREEREREHFRVSISLIYYFFFSIFINETEFS